MNVQSEAEWGDKVIPMLSKDLKQAFPQMKGFSRTNLLNMRRFALEYDTDEFVQQPVGQITRSHNILLLEKVPESREQRLRYAKQAVENGRSRNVMVIHIERKLFEAQ